MRIARKDFFFGSIAATAVAGLEASASMPVFGMT